MVNGQSRVIRNHQNQNYVITERRVQRIIDRNDKQESLMNAEWDL